MLIALTDIQDMNMRVKEDKAMFKYLSCINKKLIS